MISFKTTGGQFNARVAGVAIVDGHVLLHQGAGDDYWTLPGGRLELMETAHAALRREMLEETGLAITVRNPLCFVENFFTYEGTPYHELLLCLEMRLPTTTGAPESRFQGANGNEHLTFWWCPLNTLDAISLRPSCLRSLLGQPPTSFTHIVQTG